MRSAGIFLALVAALSFSEGSQAQGKERPMISCPENKALAGDAAAAKECAEDSLKTDQNLHRYWTQIAAENGDTFSQYNLALILLDKNRRHDRLRAVFWLNKSSKNGFALATQVLEDIKNNPNSTIPVPPPSRN